MSLLRAISIPSLAAVYAGIALIAQISAINVPPTSFGSGEIHSFEGKPIRVPQHRIDFKKHITPVRTLLTEPGCAEAAYAPPDVPLAYVTVSEGSGSHLAGPGISSNTERGPPILS